MKKSIVVATLGLLFFALACVTVNVYFPAAEVQQAADKIVDEVHGEEVSTEDLQSTLRENPMRRLFREVALFEGQAYAQADINVTTPNIRALKLKIKERYSRLRPLYDRGVIGETNNGLLSIRSTDTLNLKQKADLKKLVESENENRMELYTEIAEANDLPSDTIDDIQSIFANSWRKKAADGWWIQKDDGAWVQKKSE